MGLVRQGLGEAEPERGQPMATEAGPSKDEATGEHGVEVEHEAEAMRNTWVRSGVDGRLVSRWRRASSRPSSHAGDRASGSQAQMKGTSCLRGCLVLAWMLLQNDGRLPVRSTEDGAGEAVDRRARANSGEGRLREARADAATKGGARLNSGGGRPRGGLAEDGAEEIAGEAWARTRLRQHGSARAGEHGERFRCG